MTTAYTVTSASARIDGQDRTLDIRSITCSDTLRPGSQSQRMHHARVEWVRSGDGMMLAHADEVFDLVFEGIAEHGYGPKRYTLVSFRPSTGSYLSFKEEAVAA